MAPRAALFVLCGVLLVACDSAAVPTTSIPATVDGATSTTPSTSSLGSIATTALVVPSDRQEATKTALFLDRMAADLTWAREMVVAINASWEAGEASYAETEVFFGRMLTFTHSFFGESDPEDPTGIGAALDGFADGFEIVLEDMSELNVAVDEIDSGLKAPDDGTLRRQAVSRFVETTERLVNRIGDLRAGLGSADPAPRLPTLLTSPDSNPLLTPYDELPSCGDPGDLLAWARSSFAGWEGEASVVNATETAVWVPLLLGVEADCATAVGSGTHAAWELRTTGGDLLARAAGSFGSVDYLTPCNDPSRDFEQGDWYGRIGSGHFFRICMTQNHLYGTTAALLDRRWPIFEIELTPSIHPTETRWPGGWIETDGVTDNYAQLTAERLLHSRHEEIVEDHRWEGLPAQWPESTSPCNRFRASLGDPMAEPHGSPAVDVIELCDATGAAYWFVRSGVPLAPDNAEVVSIEGLDLRVWEPEAGRWSAETTASNIAGEYSQLRSLGPAGSLDALLASLTTLPS